MQVKTVHHQEAEDVVFRTSKSRSSFNRTLIGFGIGVAIGLGLGTAVASLVINLFHLNN